MTSSTTKWKWQRTSNCSFFLKGNQTSYQLTQFCLSSLLQWIALNLLLQKHLKLGGGTWLLLDYCQTLLTQNCRRYELVPCLPNMCYHILLHWVGIVHLPGTGHTLGSVYQDPTNDGSSELLDTETNADTWAVDTSSFAIFLSKILASCVKLLICLMRVPGCSLISILWGSAYFLYFFLQ